MSFFQPSVNPHLCFFSLKPLGYKIIIQRGDGRTPPDADKAYRGALDIWGPKRSPGMNAAASSVPVLTFITQFPTNLMYQYEIRPGISHPPNSAVAPISPFLILVLGVV